MEIKPVGEESMGVRSMCLHVETRDVRILLDAGVSLAPRRFGLPPHERELERVREVRSRMVNLPADVVTVSHYHRDHFTPWYPSLYMATESNTYIEIYRGRKILAKHPADLNWSQKRRHYGFVKSLQTAGGELIYADGGEWRFGSTLVMASQPLWHGAVGSKTGRVIGFAVIDGEERLVFLPDVEGPLEPEPLRFAESVKPTIVIVGGPAVYLNMEIEKAVENLKSLIDMSPHTLVLAHHLLRDLDWRRRVAEVLEYGERKRVYVTTYAGLAGLPEELLEARRRELYR